ncbi:hypothetical protein J6590_076410 [Homalodisca vitripennis]|nr:hypothetical protein J6590_076410 [Homalodisca vitripennis]
MNHISYHQTHNELSRGKDLAFFIILRCYSEYTQCMGSVSREHVYISKCGELERNDGVSVAVVVIVCDSHCQGFIISLVGNHRHEQLIL